MLNQCQCLQANQASGNKMTMPYTSRSMKSLAMRGAPLLAVAAAFGMFSAASTGDAAAPAAPRAFASCKACHSVEPGEMRSGPSLAGIMGRRAGTAPGFGYSQGMRDYGKVWTEQELDAFLANPTGTVPGTRMPLPTRNAEARRAIIDYLKTV